MDDADQVGAFARQLVTQALRIDGASPLDVDTPHTRTVSLENLHETITEIPGHDHHGAHAVEHDVRDGSLHSGGPRPRGRERQGLTVCTKYPLQRCTNIVEHRHKVRIEMAEYGGGECAYHARRNQTRARAEQNTFSRRKRHVYVGQRT